MKFRLPPFALLILAGLLLIVFGAVVVGQVFFWGLPLLQFYPWREFSFEMLQQGQLPLWNPYNGAGAPLIANYQSALFYPLNWPGYVLPLAWSMSLTSVLHLFIAGWGMWVFMGRLGVPSLGRGVSALAFGMTSYLVARLGTYPMVAAAAWLPWLLWAVLGVVEDPRPRKAGLLALITGLQLLAGHAQLTWYSLLLAGIFTLYWLMLHRDALWWRRLLWVGGGVILGMVIALVQLLPTAELLLTSQRAGGVDYAFAMNYSYSPVRVLNLLSPNVFGNPGAGSYLTEGAFFEDAVYIGFLPLVAALAAVVGWGRRRWRRDTATPEFLRSVPLWLAVIVIAFVFALGINTPVFPFLFEHVPTFDIFQAPVRWHLWTVFGLSVLAGFGTQLWGKGYWLLFGTRLAIAGGVGAALLAQFVVPNMLAVDDAEVAAALDVLRQAVVWTGLLGAGAGLLTLWQPAKDSAHYVMWSAVVLIFVAVDMGMAARGLNPTIDAQIYNRLPAPDSAARAYWPAEAEASVVFGHYLQFNDYRIAQESWQTYRGSHAPNINLIDRWPLLNNFEPLQVGHVAAYTGLIETYLAEGTAAPLLRAAGVDRVYQDDGTAADLSAPAERAWLVADACWHADDMAVWEALRNPDWRPAQQVHVVGAGDCAVGENISVGRVLSVEDTPNQVHVKLEVDSSGWLVLADTDYPGWVAYVDGEAQPILRANGAFRTVEIVAGVTEVDFKYQPGWLLPGAVGSIIGLVVALGLLRMYAEDKR